MKIRQRMTLLQLVLGGTVVLMAGMAFMSHYYGDYYLNRVKWSNHQLEAITSVSLYANDLSEQIAELLLIGDSQQSDYDRAAADLQLAFAHLEETTRGEDAFLTSHGKASDFGIELQRLQRMRQLHVEMDKAVKKLIVLRDAGRFDEAVQLYRQDIENRLDAEFEHLLRTAVLDEQEEVKHAERHADAMWIRLVWIISIAALLALLITVLSISRLATALLRPVDRLIEGTDAIRRGDFAARVDYKGDDELGLLAHGFNRMGEQLAEQHELVQSSQADLERQVADRTHELAKANQRLSGLDRARVQFLADISHELRTPLTALRGEAEVTLRRPPDSDAAYREVLTRVVSLSRDMSRLVDDLLFLARTETDTLRFEVERVCLQDIAAKVHQEGSALGRGQQTTLQASMPEQPIWVVGDAQRIAQALMIVIDNAVKYSPAGGTVELAMTADDRLATIVVRDQGRGIPDEDLPHVFDRSYRGASNSGSGLGIGLAIAKRLIEKHDGTIELVSEQGKYTEVRISIPHINEVHDAESATGGR